MLFVLKYIYWHRHLFAMQKNYIQFRDIYLFLKISQENY